jgi:hypothetical protein
VTLQSRVCNASLKRILVYSGVMTASVTVYFAKNALLDRRAQFGARRANDLYCKYLLDRRAKVHVSLMVRIHRW